MIPNYDRDINRKKILKTSKIIEIVVFGKTFDVCYFSHNFFSINEIPKKNQKQPKKQIVIDLITAHVCWAPVRGFLIINLGYSYA